MSLSRVQIYSLIQEIDPLLCKGSILDFLACGQRKYLLAVKAKKIFYLLLCLQEPFLRFHLIEKIPKNISQDSFSLEMARVLKEGIIKKIEMAGNDRILSMLVDKNGVTYTLTGEFFPKKPNLSLKNFINETIFSLNFQDLNSIQYPKIKHPAPEIDINVTSKVIEQEYASKERNFYFEQQKNEIVSRLRKKLVKSTKELAKAEELYEEYLSWPQKQHEALLLQSNFHAWSKGMATLEVTDWDNDNTSRKIDLNSLLDLKEQLSQRFKHIKKYKNGLEPVSNRIAELKKTKENLSHELNQAAQATDIEDLKPWIVVAKEKAKEKTKKPVEKFFSFISKTGMKIFVGKNAQANEFLTFSLAHGNDYWFHVEGYAGSHVIVKCGKNQKLDQETISDAVQLALGHSKARDKGSVEVIMSQVKYLSRQGRKGNVGRVQISKHQKILSAFDKNYFKTIIRHP